MRILKSSFIYMIGELFAKSLPFVMLPYLTRKLGPEGFGELSYYLTWFTLFGVFIGLSQEGAIARYYYFYGKKALNIIIKVGYIYNIIISASLFIICRLFEAEILSYVVLATMFQSFINVQLSLHQCQKAPYKYITIQILLSLSNVIFTITALEFFTDNLVAYRILAIIIANAITFFIISLAFSDLFKKQSRITLHRIRLSFFYILSFGVPLILHQSSLFIKGQLDRVFIYTNYTNIELGVYSAGVQLAAVLPVILLAINKALLPYFYQNLKEQKISINQIKKYAFFCTPLSAIPAMLGFILPEYLYTLLLGAQYIHSKYYTVMYLLGYGINLPYLILINYFFFYGKNLLISKITLTSSIVYLILLIIFSNCFSIKFIPFALIISNIVLLITLWICIKYVNDK